MTPKDQLIISGIIAGVLTSIIFVILHIIFISDIFFILPFALILGLITGGSLGWSFVSIYDYFNLRNLVSFLILFSIPMVMVDLVTFFSERTYSFDELVETQTLPADFLEKVIFPIIPIMLIAGIFIGIYYGKNRSAIIPATLTNIVILIGIGHNLPFTNLVVIDNLFVLLEIKILFYSVLIIMVLCYGLMLFFLVTKMNLENLELLDENKTINK